MLRRDRGRAPLRTALVIGAGFAGLAAARVLSEHCERVVVLDSGRPHGGDAPRRCIPQGQHVHLLLASGFRSLCQLFPCFEAELTAHGAASFDVGRALRYWRRGRLKQFFDGELRQWRFPIVVPPFAGRDRTNTQCSSCALSEHESRPPRG